jgi:CspA family cold shock protein
MGLLKIPPRRQWRWAQEGLALQRGVTTVALLAPHFCCFLLAQQDFGRSGRSASSGATVSDHQPKPGLWRGARRHALRQTMTRDETRRPTMQKGTVKWFNPTKGYGFIRPATGDKDVFVHISAVERAGLSTLNEGQTVEYELVTGRNGKTSAENLKVG